MGLHLNYVAVLLATFLVAVRASPEPSAVGRQASPAPLQTPSPIFDRSLTDEKLPRQNQVPFQVCPEALGKPKQSCPSCGGDTKVAGFCDNVSGEETRHVIIVHCVC